MNINILAGIGMCLLSVELIADCNTQMQETAPAGRFVIENDVTVVDTSTGLMWKRCAQGYEWSGETCAENVAQEAAYDWSEALSLTVGYSYGGHSDWRLPNANELASIAEFSCFDPAINRRIFPNTPSVVFWSNTPNRSNTIFAWGVDFKQGESKTPYRTDSHSVRLVRDYPVSR